MSKPTSFEKKTFLQNEIPHENIWDVDNNRKRDGRQRFFLFLFFNDSSPCYQDTRYFSFNHGMVWLLFHLKLIISLLIIEMMMQMVKKQ